MYRNVQPRYLVALASTIALTACSGGSSSDSNNNGTPAAGGTAPLSISLIDAPVDDVREVNVVITGISLKPADGEAFDLPLEETPYAVDLLQLTEGNAALLVDNALVEAGSYEWLRMDVDAEIDGVFDSYVVVIDTEEWYEVRVPSGTVRLVGGFDIEANQAVELTFDWDMRKGLVKPPGLGGYILKPAFRVVGTTPFGRLSGSIPVSTVTLEENECNADTDDVDYDVGNVVYIFEGHDVVVDDIDEMDAEPLATVNALVNDENTDYEYSTILPFGDYTVAFTCQGANDLAESSEAGNDDEETNTVAFFEPAVNVTLASPDDVDVVVDFGQPL